MATSSIFSSVELSDSTAIELLVKAAEASMNASFQKGHRTNAQKISDLNGFRLPSKKDGGGKHAQKHGP